MFVSIAVNSKSNNVWVLDFNDDKLLKFSVSNSLPNAESILEQILKCLKFNKIECVVITLESSSFYSSHIANFFSSNQILLQFHPFVYQLNPKTSVNNKKFFVDYLTIVKLG